MHHQNDREAELHRFILQVAERLYLAAEVLAMRAERRESGRLTAGESRPCSNCESCRRPLG